MARRPVGRKRAERAAEELLEEQDLRDPPINVDAVAQRLGIDIMYESLASDTSAVFIRQPDGSRYIGVNAGHAPTRQRFSIAHEIGHAQLHFAGPPSTQTEAVYDRPLEMMFRDGAASQGSNHLEIDANTFAAALLMPSTMIREEFGRTLRDSPRVGIDAATDALAQRFAVSVQAMRYRLINLNLVDPA